MPNPDTNPAAETSTAPSVTTDGTQAVQQPNTNTAPAALAPSQQQTPSVEQKISDVSQKVQNVEAAENKVKDIGNTIGNILHL